jgi:hypothetical protein
VAAGLGKKSLIEESAMPSEEEQAKRNRAAVRLIKSAIKKCINEEVCPLVVPILNSADEIVQEEIERRIERGELDAAYFGIPYVESNVIKALKASRGVLQQRIRDIKSGSYTMSSPRALLNGIVTL